MKNGCLVVEGFIHGFQAGSFFWFNIFAPEKTMVGRRLPFFLGAGHFSGLNCELLYFSWIYTKLFSSSTNQRQEKKSSILIPRGDSFGTLLLRWVPRGLVGPYWALWVNLTELNQFELKIYNTVPQKKTKMKPEDDGFPKFGNLLSFLWGVSPTAKRQSHHSPLSFRKRRIQYVISLSSLMVLPTLNAHATRPKILQNFAKFHWIRPFCMVRSRKKQCSVLISCCTLQCNRGTETIYLEPSKLSLDLSNLHGKATRRVVLESGFAQHFPMDSRRSYTKR